MTIMLYQNQLSINTFKKVKDERTASLPLRTSRVPSIFVPRFCMSLQARYLPDPFGTS